jgi:hypothetical protein
MAKSMTRGRLELPTLSGLLLRTRDNWARLAGAWSGGTSKNYPTTPSGRCYDRINCKRIFKRSWARQLFCGRIPDSPCSRVSPQPAKTTRPSSSIPLCIPVIVLIVLDCPRRLVAWALLLAYTTRSQAVDPERGCCPTMVFSVPTRNSPWMHNH